MSVLDLLVLINEVMVASEGVLWGWKVHAHAHMHAWMHAHLPCQQVPQPMHACVHVHASMHACVHVHACMDACTPAMPAGATAHAQL